jgi:hypothetical protein
MGRRRATFLRMLLESWLVLLLAEVRSKFMVRTRRDKRHWQKTNPNLSIGTVRQN